MLRYISNLYNLYKKNKVGFIGITLSIIFFAITTYYIFYTPQPEITYTILSDSNIVDLHKPLEDLKILFQDEDIQKNNMNLKIYSLKISNSGKENILETHYASDEDWGIKITEGKIIESRLVESNSDYLKSNLNPKIVDDKTINFKKVIFDKNDYFTLEVLVLHPRDSNINLIPFGKISGISKNQTFNKLDTTRGGVLQSILTGRWFLLLYYCFILILFAAYAFINIRKMRERVEEIIDIHKTNLTLYRNQINEYLSMFADLLKNDRIKEVLENDPDCIFRKDPDTVSGNIRTAFRNYPDSIPAYPDTLSNH